VETHLSSCNCPLDRFVHVIKRKRHEDTALADVRVSRGRRAERVR
jgi:hypothetical protein